LTPATWGFSRQFRLVKAADFKLVFAKAEKSADLYLTVLARPNQIGHARLGLAISKKTVRHAADRNRIKRQIRESFRLRRHALGNLDIVVLTRPAVNTADTAAVRRSIEKHWEILIKKCDSFWCNSSSCTASC
jgi:ribonuclease P protein component